MATVASDPTIVDADYEVTDDRPSEEAKILEDIQEAEEEAQKRKRVWEKKKEDTKRAKGEWDAAVDDLCNLIRQSKEETPLFDQIPASKPPEIPPGDESWRTVPILDILAGQAPSIGQALQEAGIATIGDLSDFTADGKKYLTDVPGIGPAKAEKIEEALAEFWKRRKEAAVPTTEEPKEEETDDDAE